MWRWLWILLLMMACSCAAPPAPQATSEAPAPEKPPLFDPRAHREPFSSGRVMLPGLYTRVQVDVYQLSLPFGSVSRNEKFWKRIDEQIVDPVTQHVLFTNGIRTGVAPIAEWDHFRDIMEEYPAVTRRSTLLSADATPIELPVQKEVDRQVIFFFDSANVLHGRTYDASQNVMTMTIQSAPRNPETVRVAMCPVVRAVRKRLEVSALGDEREIVYASPERLYEMNLRVDVPPEHFLVVAPSGEAMWPTSVGSAFLLEEGIAEQMETVLLVVPSARQVEIAPKVAESPR